MKNNIFEKRYTLRKANKFLTDNLVYPMKSVTNQDGKITGIPDYNRMSDQQKLSFWSHYYNVIPVLNLKGVQY